MSVLQNPIVGRMRQKIGGVVMSTWKGINVMRGKPLTVANPKTDAQLMRRSALTQSVAIARTLIGVISLGFKEQAVRKSPFNAFTGYNLRNSFDYSSPPAAIIEPADVLVSQGTIATTPVSGSTATAASREFTTNWSGLANDPGQSTADIAVTALYNVTQNKWCAPSGNTATRADGTDTWTAPVGFMAVGNTVRYYVFFYNTTARKSSDSITGTVVVA